MEQENNNILSNIGGESQSPQIDDAQCSNSEHLPKRQSSSELFKKWEANFGGNTDNNASSEIVSEFSDSRRVVSGEPNTEEFFTGTIWTEQNEKLNELYSSIAEAHSIDNDKCSNSESLSSEKSDSVSGDPISELSYSEEGQKLILQSVEVIEREDILMSLFTSPKGEYRRNSDNTHVNLSETSSDRDVNKPIGRLGEISRKIEAKECKLEALSKVRSHIINEIKSINCEIDQLEQRIGKNLASPIQQTDVEDIKIQIEELKCRMLEVDRALGKDGFYDTFGQDKIIHILDSEENNSGITDRRIDDFYGHNILKLKSELDILKEEQSGIIKEIFFPQQNDVSSNIQGSNEERQEQYQSIIPAVTSSSDTNYNNGPSADRSKSLAPQMSNLQQQQGRSL